MSLAYLIVAHKNPAHVRRLFTALYHPDDFFVFHFDRRAGRELHALGRELMSTYPNVATLRPRVVLWGGPQLTSVQIDAMRTALGSGRSWDYFVNLTGQDFPIKSRAAILARLGETPGASHVSYFDPLTTDHWGNARERLARYYLYWPWLERLFAVRGLGRKLKALLGTTNRTPCIPWFYRRPPTFRYYGGANHVVLSAAACRYLVSDPAAERIVNWLKPAANSDEIVFQSVLLNSPLASTVISEDLREIDFPARSPNPRILTLGHWDQLMRSTNLWARKFDPAIDAAIIEKLAAHIKS